MMKQLVAVLFLGALLNITGTFSQLVGFPEADFNKMIARSKYMDLYELRNVVRYAFQRELGPKDFGLSATRAVLLLESKENYGSLNYEEFNKVFNRLFHYLTDFNTYDADKSGTLSVNEIGKVPLIKDITSIFWNKLEAKYGRDGKMQFDGFVEAMAETEKATAMMKEHAAGPGKMSLTDEEFLNAAVLE